MSDTFKPKMKERLEYGRAIVVGDIGLLVNASAYARAYMAKFPDHDVTDRTLRSDHQRLRSELVSNLEALRGTSVGVLQLIMMQEAATNPKVAIQAAAELRQTMRYDVQPEDEVSPRQAYDRDRQGWSERENDNG